MAKSKRTVEESPITGMSVAQLMWGTILAWLIAACRFVTYVNPNITAEHFPLQPDDLRVKDVITVSIPRAMSTEQVLTLLDEKSLRPATLVELLWWWLTHPEKHSDCFVVALGSVWGGLAPYVRGDGSDRELGLCTLAVGWGSDGAFAAVSK